jgi:hypothetical protein
VKNLKCLIGKHITDDSKIYGTAGSFYTKCLRCKKRLPVSDIRALAVFAVESGKALSDVVTGLTELYNENNQPANSRI